MDESWSRTDQKRANRVKEDALARLSDDLARLGEAKLAALGLSEELLDAVVTLKRIPSAPARHRQLRRVRALLRDADFYAVQARVTALHERGVLPEGLVDDERTRREATWILRLIGEGPSALDAFLLEFPQADRTHVRQLVRSVTKASHDRRLKAEAKLRIAIRGFLR
jgi:ribosome-associated protein